MATTNNPAQFTLVAHPPLLMAAMLLHAVYRRVDDILVGKLPQARCDPSAAGHHDSDSGGHPAGKPDVHHAAAVSANHVSPGAICSHGI
jgi:hypothetical protein